MPVPIVLVAEELSPAGIAQLQTGFEIRYTDGADRSQLLTALAPGPLARLAEIRMPMSVRPAAGVGGVRKLPIPIAPRRRGRMLPTRRISPNSGHVPSVIEGSDY